jgi:hypothetical protein
LLCSLLAAHAGQRDVLFLHCPYCSVCSASVYRDRDLDQSQSPWRSGRANESWVEPALSVLPLPVPPGCG